MSPREYLDLAARIASRAAGDVEPNPMVGAVIVRDGRIIGMGHHKKFGRLHAEREALADCRRRGEDPRGATIFVTLEPCCHTGKQPPCTEALIEAGVASVIAARPDPNPVSAGGAEVLRRAGVACEFSDASRNAIELSAPFVKRITTDMPWVIAKWAQTVDGRMVTRPGEPRWISGEESRRRVHRLRARVDDVITGIGTVLADDPLLTARGIARVRRVGRRVVIDPRMEIPLNSKLVRTARDVPLMIQARVDSEDPSVGARAAALTGMNLDIAIGFLTSPSGRGCDLPGLLRVLARGGSTNAMLECGPRLLGSFFDADLIDECVIHIGSAHLGEAEARAAAERVSHSLADSRRFELRWLRRSGEDTEAIYRRPTPPA